MLDLFVRDAISGRKVPAIVSTATEQDLAATKDWQTSWETPFAHDLPNKVALRRTDGGELLGLMSYELYDKGLAVEVIYMENARHSNANLLHAKGGHKRYYGIAKALFATMAKAPKEREIPALFSGSHLSYNEREIGLTVPCLSCHTR